MVKEILVRAKERTNKTGNKFMSFKARKLDGSFVPLKFRQEVEGLPKEEGMFVMQIESTNMNRRFTDYGEEWWCRERIEGCEPYVTEDVAKDEF